MNVIWVLQPCYDQFKSCFVLYFLMPSSFLLSASDVEILTKTILQVYYFIVLFISYSKLRSNQMKMHPFQR